MTWEIIKDWWFLFVAIIGAVIFSIKSDLRSQSNAKDIEDTRTQMAAALKKIDSQRRDDLHAAEKSREETNAVLREMRDDQRAAAAALQKFLGIIIENQKHGEH